MLAVYSIKKYYYKINKCKTRPFILSVLLSPSLAVLSRQWTLNTLSCFDAISIWSAAI